MIAFLVAGLILGVLAHVLRRGAEHPSLPLRLVTGVVGALIGGAGLNLALLEPVTGLNPWSFAMACVLAFVLLGLLEGGVGRRRAAS